MKNIGAFSYFATGEGDRVLIATFETGENEDPHFAFYKNYVTKYFKPFEGSFDGFKQSWEFFQHGMSVFSLQDSETKEWHEDAWKNFLETPESKYLEPEFWKTLKTLFKEGSMVADRDFVFWFQYNQS